jgi:hypothetical protein
MDITLETYIKKVEDLLYLREQNSNNNNSGYIDNELQYIVDYLEQTLDYIKRRISSDDHMIRPREAAPLQSVTTPLQDIISQSAGSVSPRTHLTWIEELGQYSININNMVLRGNIGDIYNKKIINKGNVHTHQVAICVHGNECRNVLSEKYCKYYHDPMELLQLKKQGKISDKYFQSIIKLKRNFSNTAWLYAPDNFINRHLRCIGSAATLDNDISILMLNNDKKNIIETYKQQVMHDILVLLVLKQYNAE